MVDTSLFMDFLGSGARIEVIDFLIGHYRYAFPISEIADNTCVDKHVIESVIDDLEEHDMVVFEEREIDDIKLKYFSLNIRHPVIDALMLLDLELIDSHILGVQKSKPNRIRE